MKTVLVVDDSPYMRSLVVESLRNNGFQIIAEASNGEEAIDLAHEFEPDLITLDNVMPDMLGLEVLRAFKKGNLKSKVIIVSAVGQESMKNKGIELGAIGYVTKPFTNESLLADVNQILHQCESPAN